MRVSENSATTCCRDSSPSAFEKELSEKAKARGRENEGPGRGASGKPGRNGAGGDKGNAPDNAGGGRGNSGGMDFTTLAIGEEDGGGGAPMPVEPGGGIGDGAGPIPDMKPEIGGGGVNNPGDMGATTLAIGEEDGGGGAPMPVEPGGGIGDGAGPIPGAGDGGSEEPVFTTLALGEEDGGGGPIPVEPDGGIGDGAGPLPGTPNAGGAITGTRGNDTLLGTDSDDAIKGRQGNDVITTGQGNDVVRGGQGDDIITVDGSGDKKINGGSGNDTLNLTGQEASYGVRQRGSGSSVYTAADGSRIVARNIETVNFTGDGPDVTTLAIGEEDGGGSIDPDPGTPIGGEPPQPGVFEGTNGDDTLIGTDADESFTTGQGNDTVNAGGGDDRIAVTGTGNKAIDGGPGTDTVTLKGTQTNYTVLDFPTSQTYVDGNGSEISVTNVESVAFTDGPSAPSGFTANFALEPNDIGATSLDIANGEAVLTGSDTNFTFTGVDESGLAMDGPLIATGGSGTINGEETTAVPLSPFGDSVLTVGSGFNLTGTQGVNAAFANGATLDTTVTRPAV